MGGMVNNDYSADIPNYTKLNLTLSTNIVYTIIVELFIIFPLGTLKGIPD